MVVMALWKNIWFCVELWRKIQSTGVTYEIKNRTEQNRAKQSYHEYNGTKYVDSIIQYMTLYTARLIGQHIKFYFHISLALIVFYRSSKTAPNTHIHRRDTYIHYMWSTYGKLFIRITGCCTNNCFQLNKRFNWKSERCVCLFFRIFHVS